MGEVLQVSEPVEKGEASDLSIRDEGWVEWLVFGHKAGRYAKCDLRTGEVESNVPRVEQVYVIVDALRELLRSYGIEPTEKGD